jgi:hypothetical protein
MQDCKNLQSFSTERSILDGMQDCTNLQSFASEWAFSTERGILDGMCFRTRSLQTVGLHRSVEMFCRQVTGIP